MPSSWKIENTKKYPKSSQDIEVDVVIVGGGLAGVWSAYMLAQEGKSVAVLEKNRIGSGETEYTTAFLNQTIDTSLADLVEMFGQMQAKLVWQSHRQAIERIEEVSKKEKISCKFKCSPLYIYAKDEKEFESLAEEYKWAEKFGFPALLKKGSVGKIKCYGSLVLLDQAKYHPIKFINGLAKAAQMHGAQIFENSEVTEISPKGKPYVVLKNGRKVRATNVVIATYDPLGNPRSTKFKKGMYTSYVYELAIKNKSLPEAMYIDMHNPYHYVRIDRGPGSEDRMIVGGEDHRAELKIPENKNFKALKQYIDEDFPDLDYKIKRKWIGAILEPSDGLALIGKSSANRYVACAFSGNGMTYAAITGVLIRDLILGKFNSYQDLYDPQRKMSSKALSYKFRDYAGEFVGGAAKNIWKRT